MTDEELHKIAELVAKVMFFCKEYANENDMDFLFTVSKTAEADRG